MRSFNVLITSLVLAALGVAVLLGPARAAKEERIENVSVVSGDLYISDYSTIISGQIYDGYWSVGARIGASYYATMDIRGTDWFRAHIGFRDDHTGNVSVSIEVDGDVVWRQGFKGGEKAVPVNIPLTGKKALTLRSNTGSIVFAEAKLIKGQPSPLPSPGTAPSAPSPTPTASAPFVVDPNDLERLAASLRKRVDAKPDIKARVDRGKSALMTFTLVDIGSPSVAINVAEDLYTSMINSDFRLVERGQLDRLIKELKIQDSALIDPATAQKIGQVSGCDMIVLGSISDRGNVVVVNARIMETSTGTSIVAERVEMKKNPINR